MTHCLLHLKFYQYSYQYKSYAPLVMGYLDEVDQHDLEYLHRKVSSEPKSQIWLTDWLILMACQPV